MRLAAHQPDLLPYPGFWQKMARADLFDVAVYDQFQSRGYQKRVKMRDSWATLPVVKAPSGASIYEIRLQDGAVESLWEVIEGRYRSAAFWKERSGMVLEWVESARADRLWQFNLSLMVQVRDWLGLRTPVAVAKQPAGAREDGLLDVCGMYPGVDSYLSGDGGTAYLPSDVEDVFRDRGIAFEWMDSRPTVTDSVLSPLFDERDAVEAVLQA